MRKIYNIRDYEIILTDLNPGQGKIAIINYSENRNYSYQWGAMGNNITSFISGCGYDYFLNCLLSRDSKYSFSSRQTFKALRKFIREELGLPWYKHLEFQKSMRKDLVRFQKTCESNNDFVYGFDQFVNNLDYNLIENRYDSQMIEKDFTNISEPWHIIETEFSREYIEMKKIYNLLIKEINDDKRSPEEYREISHSEEASGCS